MKLYYIIIFIILFFIFIYLRFYYKKNNNYYELIEDDIVANESENIQNVTVVNNITENETDTVLNIAEYYYNCNDNSECAICFENLNNTMVRQFSCMHKYHKDCIFKWNKIKINNIQCPECGN